MANLFRCGDKKLKEQELSKTVFCGAGMGAEVEYEFTDLNKVIGIKQLVINDMKICAYDGDGRGTYIIEKNKVRISLWNHGTEGYKVTVNIKAIGY